VTLADPDAVEDPFVRGINHFFQISIAEDPRRDIGPQRGDFGARSSQSGLLENKKPSILQDAGQNV
jgi:hypothetical protein